MHDCMSFSGFHSKGEQWCRTTVNSIDISRRTISKITPSITILRVKAEVQTDFSKIVIKFSFLKPILNSGADTSPQLSEEHSDLAKPLPRSAF